jgi:FlaA1/EpsC-like NDP-sugar epimerase
MTRFIMSLEEAVDLVLFAFETVKNGDCSFWKHLLHDSTQQKPFWALRRQKEDIKVLGIRHGGIVYEIF